MWFNTLNQSETSSERKDSIDARVFFHRKTWKMLLRKISRAATQRERERMDAAHSAKRKRSIPYDKRSFQSIRVGIFVRLGGIRYFIGEACEIRRKVAAMEGKHDLRAQTILSTNLISSRCKFVSVRSNEEKRIQLKWNTAGSDAWNVFRKGWKIRSWWLLASSLLVSERQKNFRTFISFHSCEIYERMYKIFSNSMQQYLDTCSFVLQFFYIKYRINRIIHFTTDKRRRQIHR